MFSITDKTNIVLLAGSAAAGKTTVATYLYDNLTKYLRLSIVQTGFAAPIKHIAREYFGWDGNKDERGRRLLQVLGAEAGRAYDENLWVRYFENMIFSGRAPYNFVLVDDWRFENEYAYLANKAQFEIVRIRVNRPGLPQLNHISEMSLPLAENEVLSYNKDSYYNFVINNNGGFGDLYAKLTGVLEYLESKIQSF